MDFDNEVNQRYYYKTATLICITIVICVISFFAYYSYKSQQMIKNGYEYRKVIVDKTTTLNYEWQWTKPTDVDNVGVVKEKEDVLFR